MRLLADSTPWYTSGVFLGIAAIVVGVLGALLGVWAAFKAANQRPELAWQVRALVPLLSDGTDKVRDSVEVRADGRVLGHAQVIELEVANTSKRDIPSHAFDQSRPLRIDVGATIVKRISTVGRPADLRAPHIEIDNTALVIGPDLIKSGQAVTVSLLVDGADPRVTIPEPPFIDVNVRERSDASEYWLDNAETVVGRLVLSILYVFGGAGAATSLLTRPLPSSKRRR